ncbi:MAG TPA: crosslink repair DNA glycosylase YcaQ family protein, partial [Vicinamibacterales bacterium]|nr:crosslink repair DNA glycosylase YcaQ family protein [Vicinamibacterales bacterium]
ARAPDAKRLSRDEALAKLTARFFRSHGPATTHDFVWWSGLTMADTKRGLEMNRAKSHIVDGHTYWTVGRESRPAKGGVNAHLLPIYDEYLVSYRDRVAVPHGPTVVKSRARESVMFQHSLVIAGQVAGTWRMTKAAGQTAIAVFPLRTLTKPERSQVKRAAERYSRFIGIPVSASIAS